MQEGTRIQRSVIQSTTRFLGVAKNVGDALTFVILSQEGTRIQHSVIRSMTGKPPAGFPNMRISHDSLTENTNPNAPALLQLTLTTSTNVTIQVDERNGGLMTDLQKFWCCRLPKIQIQKIQKLQIRF